MVEKKLGNHKFVSNAPATVVDKEHQRQAEHQAQVEKLGKLGWCR